jgi:hypothetical protein
MSSWLCQHGIPNPVHPQHQSLKHHTINQLWSKGPIFCSNGFHKADRCRTKYHIATRCGMSNVLHTCRISYNACCSHHSCLRPDEVHRGNIESHCPVIELLHHASICQNTIPCIGYDSAHQQRCILHLRIWGTRPHRQPFLYGATRWVDAAHQWSYPLSRPLISFHARLAFQRSENQYRMLPYFFPCFIFLSSSFHKKETVLSCQLPYQLNQLLVKTLTSVKYQPSNNTMCASTCTKYYYYLYVTSYFFNVRLCV